jgi:hypothetical protein
MTDRDQLTLGQSSSLERISSQRQLHARGAFVIPLSKRVASEAIGGAMLVAAVVGSGIWATTH